MKNYREFITESINTTSLINDLIVKFGSNGRDINSGQCGEFAYKLLDLLGGETDNTFIVITPDFSENDNVINTTDKNDKRCIYNFTKTGNLDLFESHHAWVHHNGKNYDAQSPNGEEDIANMLYFKEWIKHLSELRKENR